jgi:hypothetical protein
MNPELNDDKIHDGERRGSIRDEKLPHRFGNRKQRRKLQSEVRKLMHSNPSA